MTAENLASVSAVLADATRARMLVALMDGRAWTARELAHHAGVAASTATEHLHRLVDRGLLIEHRQGRHRYVQLADAKVAAALESVAALGNQPSAPVRGLRQASANASLAQARTCYDHLAGTLGIAVTDALIRLGVLLGESLDLTPQGVAWFSDVLHAPYEPGRRTATRACIDWTERRVHLGGALGAHLTHVFHEREWIRPTKTSRAITVTTSGSDALRHLLSIDYESFRRSDGAVASTS